MLDQVWNFVLNQISHNGVVYNAFGEPYAVDITNPVGFTAYIGMAFVLYAIRETQYVSTRFLPLVAIILGLLYSCLVEYQKFDEESVVAGIRLALLGIGAVATVKYVLENPKNENSTTLKKGE
jgi:ABC-type uncharacterized transport system permease subunit